MFLYLGDELSRYFNLNKNIMLECKQKSNRKPDTNNGI